MVPSNLNNKYILYSHRPFIQNIQNLIQLQILLILMIYTKNLLSFEKYKYIFVKYLFIKIIIENLNIKSLNIIIYIHNLNIFILHINEKNIIKFHNLNNYNNILTYFCQ